MDMNFSLARRIALNSEPSNTVPATSAGQTCDYLRAAELINLLLSVEVSLSPLPADYAAVSRHGIHRPRSAEAEAH